MNQMLRLISKEELLDGGSVNLFAKEEILIEESSLSASGGSNTQTSMYGGGGSAVAGIITSGTFVVKYSKVF